MTAVPRFVTHMFEKWEPDEPEMRDAMAGVAWRAFCTNRFEAFTADELALLINGAPDQGLRAEMNEAISGRADA